MQVGWWGGYGFGGLVVGWLGGYECAVQQLTLLWQADQMVWQGYSSAACTVFP